MLRPGDRDYYAGNPADQMVGLGSAELHALAVALGKLVETSDGVADAVTRHDRVALVEYNEKADALVDDVNRLTASLTESDRNLLPDMGVPALCERLAVGVRRNAYLIEQAWATDAALMRMLFGLGRVGPDGAAGAYSTPSGPTCVDRGA